MARRARARSRSRRPEVVPGKVGDPMVRRRHWSPDPKRNTEKNVDSQWFLEINSSTFQLFFCWVHWVQKQFYFKGLHKIREQNRRKRSFSVSWPRRIWNLLTFNAKKKILSDIFQESQVIGYVFKDIRVDLYQCIPSLEWSSHVSMNPGALPAFWGPWRNSEFESLLSPCCWPFLIIFSTTQTKIYLIIHAEKNGLTGQQGAVVDPQGESQAS